MESLRLFVHFDLLHHYLEARLGFVYFAYGALFAFSASTRLGRARLQGSRPWGWFGVAGLIRAVALLVEVVHLVRQESFTTPGFDHDRVHSRSSSHVRTPTRKSRKRFPT
jgi:hypothetical protein